LTIDTHHHMLPDFFWRETENADAPVGELAPLRAILGGNAVRLFARLPVLPARRE
jgi:hypothetical protein